MSNMDEAYWEKVREPEQINDLGIQVEITDEPF
jgi:hypothetical protein